MWLAVLTLLCGASCQRVHLARDYRTEPFWATVAWTVGELTVSAELTAEPSAVSGGTLRMELTSPDTLDGIVLTRAEGVWQVSCGEIVTEGSLWGELTAYAELAVPEGEVIPVCETTLRGESLLYAEIVHKTEEGEERVYELYVEAESGVPREIRSGERSLEILCFEVGA